MNYKIIVAVLLILVVGTNGAIFARYVFHDNTKSSGQTTDNQTEDTGLSKPSGKVNVSSRLSNDGKKLDLSDANLSEITADVYNKTSVQELKLTNNRIQALPPEMGRMNNLEVVNLSASGLKSLFPEIAMWTNLRTLEMTTTDITVLPPEIGQLKKLELLDISYNNLNAIPSEIAGLKDTLKKLILSGNPMDEAEVARVKSLLPQTDVTYSEQ